MTEDTFYVMFAILIVLFLILLSRQFNKKFCVINFVSLIIYNGSIYALKNYNSEYGNSLVWLILMFLLSIIHSLILICYIFLRYKNKKVEN